MLQNDVNSTSSDNKNFTISASAAQEIKRLSSKRNLEGKPITGLRVGIRGGGCTGFSYLFEWSESPARAADQVYMAGDVAVFIDPKSLVYLKGTELDFVRNMMGYGFKFNNPNAKGACGCGDSVQF